ncbi:MAG: type II secretion system F family protein [Planctomycetaceae bacterium]|nr:type II secretion system F family protein [Planctomycetaceae bacterium]
MLLISRALQSELPLSEVIRLLVNDDKKNRTNRSLLRFASLLDEGLEPVVAVRKAKLPRRLAVLLETAFKSGNFPEYFAELTETERIRFQTFQMLSNLLAYPCLLFVVTLVIFGLMTLTTLQFGVIYHDFDATLPAMTKIAIIVGKTMIQPKTYVILFGGIIVFVFLQRLLFSAFWFYVPILGGMFRSVASQKLLVQLSFSMKRGVPIDRALELAAGSFSMNRAYRKNCLKAAALAKKGVQFSEIVSLFPLIFPRWLVPFIRTAEKNDTIPLALRHGIDILEKDQSGISFLFTIVFLPVTYFIIFSFIVFFIIAMFLPLIKLITALSG